MKNLLTLATATLLLAGCSTTAMIATNKELPQVYVDVNKTHQIKNDIKITLLRFGNYTDTPKAGQRATNIVEGVLLAKGYDVTTHMMQTQESLSAAQAQARKDNAKYFLTGGVSEWRYKTGIDGEPAVSLKLSLYKTQNAALVWSATGSDSDWGTGSIGTTAQKLIEKMTAK